MTDHSNDNHKTEIKLDKSLDAIKKEIYPEKIVRKESKILENSNFEKKILETDPLLIVPPDFTKAKKHGKAHMIGIMGNSSDRNREYCECCHMALPVKPYPLCCPTRQLEDLGSGFPLYYQFKSYTQTIFILLTLFVGIYSTIVNFRNGRGSDWNNDLNPSFEVSLSLGSYGREFNIVPASLRNQVILNFVALILILLSISILIRFQRNMITQIDNNVVSPSDYAIYIKNLPLNTTEDELKEYLMKAAPGIDIVYVNFVYKIGDLIVNIREREKWIGKKIYLDRYRINKGDKVCYPPDETFCGCLKKSIFPREDEINKQIEAFSAKVNQLEEKFGQKLKNTSYIGNAFVICNSEQDIYKLIKMFNPAWHKKLLGVFFTSMEEYMNYKGKKIKVYSAPEPSDILWENLHIKFWERFSRAVIIYLLSTVLLTVCFLICFGLSFINTKYSEKIKNDAMNSGEVISVTSLEYWVLRIVNILSSFVVIVINIMLSTGIRIFSRIEKHQTFTYYNLAVAFKLTIALFLNTAIIPLLVNSTKQDWFKNGGLVSNIFYNFISVSFIQPLFYYLNLPYFMTILKRRSALNKGVNSDLNQKQANDLFVNPPIDMALFHANTMQLLMFTLFYLPVLPVAPIIAFGGSIFSYWINKYLTLRRYRRPEVVGSSMATFFAAMMPFVVIIYGVSNFIFPQRVMNNDLMKVDKSNPIGIVGLILSVVYAVVPIYRIFNYALDLCKFMHVEEVSVYNKYKDIFLDFISDYNRENPATKKEAEKMRIMQLKEKKKISEEEYGKLLEITEKHSKFDFIAGYSIIKPQMHEANNVQQSIYPNYQYAQYQNNNMQFYGTFQDPANPPIYDPLYNQYLGYNQAVNAKQPPIAPHYYGSQPNYAEINQISVSSPTGYPPSYANIPLHQQNYNNNVQFEMGSEPYNNVPYNNNSHHMTNYIPHQNSLNNPHHVMHNPGFYQPPYNS